MNRLSFAQQSDLAHHLVHGVSIASTATLCNVSKKSVLRNLLWIGAACQIFHDVKVRCLKTTRIEADEVWGFIYRKSDVDLNDGPEDRFWGDVWTWVTYDPDAKLVVNWHVGGHGYTDALSVMLDLASRIAGRVQITTDQLAVYRNAVEEAFGNRADYATISKIMHDPTKSPDLKFQQPKLKENRIASVFGNPDPDLITTTGIECQNTRLRCWNRRYVRAAITFSRSLPHLKASVALNMCYANFCRIPRTIRCTPAMEAGLTDHVWTIDELIAAVNVDAVRFGGPKDCSRN